MTKYFLFLLLINLFFNDPHAQTAGIKKPLNIIFILSDDHRYDAMGFMNKMEGLQTTAMDRMAREGAHLKNAFVSTALCSPSRASILTGQYAHTHKVVDNDASLPAGLKFFPEYLQKHGYKTAFFGKWHIGHTSDNPQPGFDHWESFKGQGVYYNPELNINGKRIAYSDSTYTTDLLTDHALDWLNSLKRQQPFFVYLSHKGVHAEFLPAKRHNGKYENAPIKLPPSFYLTATDSSANFGTVDSGRYEINYADIPEWVRKQRYSWHGVDYMYHGSIRFDDFYHRYLETLQAVDESIMKMLDWVKEHKLEQNTLVVYMGDNGFSFGEHGLIDKRHAYEESMRVPLLFWSPGFIRPGTACSDIVMNVDIAPTFLDLARISKPKQMQGNSFAPILQNKKIQWRKQVQYEYYWEAAFPQTPTIFAIRDDRYKYIYNHGVWDINELYDLQKDPYEMNNLIRKNEMRSVGLQLKDSLFNWLQKTNGLLIPLKKPIGDRNDNRYRSTY